MMKRKRSSLSTVLAADKYYFRLAGFFFFNFHVKNTQSEIKMTIYLNARITVFVENFLSHHDYVPQIEPFNRLRD